ncbi:site-2 protease family protein [Enorma burkinafasonensis]|uniref:site-2 protease family protein n=1 Tax=Enorma burkinafasonensis TaxID=2590867 RepID=UPI0026EE40D9|nr:site-2 protease family protein [Enorma burkinafasonensis]MCI7731074.1 site-2 protease family protein [Enorma burkinafasonensis]
MDRIVSLLLSAVAVILGIVVHESAHALAAYVLGDPTARSRGRFSLNPLNHIDPFGTVLLPLLLMLAGGPVFAYAKPVPVYLGNLKHPERDEVLVALAGPVSNVLLAAVFAALYGALRAAVIAGALPLELAYTLSGFLITALVTNLSLAFFNLIPLPPLDGSTIIVPFLKGEALRTYRRIQAYAMPILIVVLYLLPSFTGIDLIGVYFDFTVYPLANWMLSFVL